MSDNRDWAAIRAYYVQGEARDPDGDPAERNWPSLDQVSARFDIPRVTVARHSTADKWTERRDAFRHEVDEQRRQIVMQQHAEKAARVDNKALDVADAGFSLIVRRMAAVTRAELRLGDDERGRMVVSSELSTLGLAGMRFLHIKARVLGQPGEVPTAEALERELRVGEWGIAERLQEHLAAREMPAVDEPVVDVEPEPVGEVEA